MKRIAYLLGISTLFLTIGLSLNFSLTGCSKSKSDKSSSAQTGSGGLKKGGTIRYLMTSDPSSLNPFVSSGIPQSEVLAYVHESLLGRNIDTNEYIPGLAKEWKVSEDKMSFSFTLRDNAFWSDGKPVTMDDVVFSFKALLDNKYAMLSRVRNYVEKIKEFKV